ncbi:MAG: ABC-2 type transport system permease protein [Polaribacter sp.]|jgi:ABC-2 type transport system permease protein
MNKLWLIIQREYLTRVKKRSFIIATLLTPIAFALFFMVVGLIFAYDSGESLRVVFIDPGQIMKEEANLKSEDDNSLHFIKSSKSIGALKELVNEGKYDGVLVLPAIQNIYNNKDTVFYYSDNQISLNINMAIKSRVGKSIREYKIRALDIDQKKLDALKSGLVLDPVPISENATDESSMTSIIGAGIGGVMGFIMYITVFIYGMMVMRSVMEEKTNRIVEIMISSVTPFQLMMGKIIGVGAVGLTQVGIWMILIPVLGLGVQLLFGFNPDELQQMNSGAPPPDMEELGLTVHELMNEIASQNWLMIIPLFIFFFLGGYFLYASLFAAVGSAMGDDMGEGQALTIPITIPVVLALYIMMAAVQAPHSNLAVWSSIFPLFSPIVMPARLAFDPPLWQIILSITVLALSSIFFVWLSGRIYRVGILMYGKKVTFRELGKWLFYRD